MQTVLTVHFWAGCFGLKRNPIVENVDKWGSLHCLVNICRGWWCVGGVPLSITLWKSCQACLDPAVRTWHYIRGAGYIKGLLLLCSTAFNSHSGCTLQDQISPVYEYLIADEMSRYFFFFSCSVWALEIFNFASSFSSVTILMGKQ